jgi:hypothetical protein
MFARSDLGHSRGDGERSAGERDDMIGADLFASLEPVRRDRPRLAARSISLYRRRISPEQHAIRMQNAATLVSACSLATKAGTSR